jgi:hypothetical protein
MPASRQRATARLRKRLAAIKAGAQVVRLIHEQVSDPSDSRSEALIAMIQTLLFEAMLSLQTEDVPASRKRRLSTLCFR